ncbi:MAG TPA: heavy metal-binding domain-containing protein [Phycisphaerae bacterium]|nr:heavy metal-binding domain-containing protein [Phycisphaerae bacterium]
MRIRPCASAGLSLLIGAASFCAAHEGDFVISRDDASPPGLHINGPNNLLDGSDCIDLIPGDAQFTGFWFNDAPGFSTMKQDGDIRGRHRLLSGHRVALRIVRADSEFSLLEPSTWRTVLTTPGDTYPFFHNSQGDFSIQMVPKCRNPGRTVVVFQLVDLAGLHADSEPFSLCFAADVHLELSRTADQFLRFGPQKRFRSLAALSYPFLVDAINPRQAASSELHAHSHSESRPLGAPATFQAAIAELRIRLHEIDTWASLRKYSHVPAAADLLSRLIGMIPGLIVSPGSGVSLADRELLINLSANAIPTCTHLRFSAGMSDDEPVREYLQELTTLLSVCERNIPARYVCPMRCEGEKRFDAPGKCPVCRMALVDSRAHQDHRPKHGGIFFMAPDGRHHLEGTTAEGGEFRIYFYNEFTRPIPAGAFQTRALAGGNPEAAPLKLSVGPNAEYQFARISSTVSPLRIKLFIDFGDDAGPQVFDFDFPP